MRTTFKNFLNENVERPFLTDEDQIEQWLGHYDVRNYSIGRDGSVHVANNVDIKGYGLTYLPVQFSMIEGSFNISYNSLTSLRGCPRKVLDDFDCTYNKDLTSYKYLPQIVGNTIYTGNDNVTSLEGLDFNSLEWRRLKLDFLKVNSHCMGLIHVKTLKSVSDSESRILINDEVLSRSLYAWSIIRKYIGKPEDFFECQAELIEHGFDEYAKL